MAVNLDLLLNFLKIAGLLITAAAGILSTLYETKAPDKKALTYGGKLFLVGGIVGAIIAIGSQLAEWDKAANAEQEARAQNTKVLTQIERALTRINYIQVSYDISIPVNQLTAVYLEKIKHQIADFIKLDPDMGEEVNGMQVQGRSDDYISMIRVTDRSSAFPTVENSEVLGAYFNALIPRIAIRRASQTPDERDFAELFVYGQSLLTSELQMTASGHGERYLTIVLNDAQNQIRLGLFGARAVEIPESQRIYKAGTISSLTDLENASLIFYFTRGQVKEVNDLMSASRLSRFVLDVDGTSFSCSGGQLQKIETHREPLAYKCNLASGR